jgi:hypothetical protein
LNNKILSIKNTSAIFLATVLVAGTIALSSPSFMTNVSAQSESYYGMDNNNYKSQYGQDNKYKSKDSNVVVKKINCNNVNVNVNGLELNGLPPFLGNLLASEGQDGYGDASSFGSSSYGYGEQSGYDKNNNSFKFVCVNNNNNTVVFVNETTPEPPEPTITCEECFTENILDELQLTNFTGTLVVYTEFGDLEGLCEFLSDPSFTNNEKIAQLSLIFSRTLIPIDVRLSILECLDERGIINVGSGGDHPNR